MHGDIFVFLVPIAALSIPIVKIIANHQYKLMQLKLQHERSDDRSELSDVKARMAQMEERILTLQDIVISGDYEVQRRLRQAEIDSAATAPYAKPSPQRARAGSEV